MRFARLTAPVVAVVLFVSLLVSCGGSVNATLNATASGVSRSDFLEKFLDDSSGAEFLEAGLGMTEKELREKFSEDCYAAELSVNVTNKNSFAVNILALDVRNNGSKKIYISTVGDAVVGLPKNYEGSQTVSFHVIAPQSIPLGELLAEIGKMDIRIVYADAATGVEELSAAKDGQLKYESLSLPE